MMNGSAAVEGFVPRRDATVVTRLLDAGAVLAGKAVCENLCFSGGSHTAGTGQVLNDPLAIRAAVVAESSGLKGAPMSGVPATLGHLRKGQHVWTR